MLLHIRLTILDPIASPGMLHRPILVLGVAFRTGEVKPAYSWGSETEISKGLTRCFTSIQREEGCKDLLSLRPVNEGVVCQEMKQR
jgi:hypothetical protein